MKKDSVLTEPDAMGRHWVYVTPTEAFGHPRGRPGVIEYGIAVWFAGVSSFEAALNISFGSFGIVPIVFTLLMLVCAAGLIFRAPWSYVLAILLAVREMFGFIQLIGGGAFEVPPALAAYGVINAILGAGVIFYLLEADRPNLIYRHRYRSYRAEAQEREE
ncbi:MAG: hypothetical protein AAFM92_06965 [Pseudomonadota bacterium]